MIKIICFGLLLTCWVNAKAQQSLIDSLQALPQKLAIDPNISTANCTNKVNSYKQKFTSITIEQWDTTLRAIRKLNSELINPVVKNCPAAMVVSRLDSMLNAQMKAGYPDSLRIMNAISVVKSRFAGLVRIRLDVSDSIVKSKRPMVSIHSFESFIAQHSGDSLPFEIFVSPNKKYHFTTMADGYIADLREIHTSKDTLISVDTLQKIDLFFPVPVPTWLEKYWWVVAILSIVAGLVLGKIFFGSRKKPNLQNPDPGLQKELSEKNKIIENNRKQIERLHADHLVLAKSIKEDNRSGTAHLSSRHFVTEIMMTAGPRKKPMNEPDSDKDLGEDVSGFITVGDQLLVWLLDGTSDLYCLKNPVNKREYFSSRLLAQSIARGLKSHFTIDKSESLDAAMAKVLSEVKNDWMITIKNLPESEKSVLKNNIREGNFPECAATVLVGRLSLDGTLNVYRSGDSKMFLFTDNSNFLDTPLGSKNDLSNDRVFFRIVAGQQGEPDIVHNQPLFETNSYSHIETMIGFSDGIGKETEEQLQKAFANNPEGVREEIMYQLQGTEDDKALFIIEIKS